jgi:hypothetical protein
MIAPELQSIVESAAQAASAGDFVSAERLLREVASRQEAELGPTHPDLANTFNNLGVVCENAGRPDDAEDCYRRAYAIAVSTRASDDPVVITSRNNLREFCEARGRLFEPEPPPSTELEVHREAPSTAASLHESEPEASWTAAPLHESELEALSTAAAMRESELEALSTAASMPESEPGGSRDRIVAVVLIGLALVLFAWYVPWRDSTEPSVGGADASSAVPSAPAALRTPAPAEALPAKETPRPAASAPPRPTSAPARTSSASPTISVVEARLCRSLSRSDWRCVPAESGSAPGPFYYYTRLASARDATIRHRWYYEGRLQQSVALEVGANAKAGYRTYSRQTVAAGRSGNWRVELVSPDGGLLHEERFVVASR